MSAHTSGPWAWFGDPKHGGFYLATVDRGRRYVMGFERMGFNKAQPTFQVDGVMVDGRDLCRFEVAPEVIGIAAAKKQGSGVYRFDITEFDHPDARLIAVAPDHAAIARAMCIGAARWVPWGDGRGEFCMNGLRHATKLDEFGVPAMTSSMRAEIAKATK